MNKSKNKTKPIDNTTSIYLRFLHQENGVSKAELARRYPQHVKRSVYRHASKPKVVPPPDQRKQTGVARRYYLAETNV